MKILLVGSTMPSAIEHHYAKWLRHLGAEVEVFNANGMANEWAGRNLLNRALNRFGIYKNYSTINKLLFKEAERFKPKVIFVFKGMELLPETLKNLRNKHILVNFNPDHPFIISQRGTGNRNVTDSIGLYHLHFCYNSTAQARIESEYHIPCRFLPFGYDLSNEWYEEVKNTPEICKICFLGNPDKIRVQAIQTLARAGMEVDVYGYGWEKTAVAQTERVRVFPPCFDIDFWKVLRTYRVQLNVFRPHNIGSHNMRTFEIPAVGGIQLAPFSEEHASFFEENKEIFFYKTEDEMISQAARLLKLDLEIVAQIRNQARFRSVSGKYSYADRAAFVYGTLSGFQMSDYQ